MSAEALLRGVERALAYPCTVGEVLIVLAVVLAVYLWMVYRRHRQPSTIRAFSTEAGEVTVNRAAVADLVQQTSSHVNGIQRCGTRIYRRGDALEIRLRVQMIEGYTLVEAEAELRNRVRHALQQTLGIENVGAIHTTLASLAVAHRSRSLSGSKPSASGERDPTDEG